MAPPIILSEGLTKDYHLGPHTVHALRGVSVTIERGDFVAVMGPSGQPSGGQQQRVAIARAPVNDPAVILADEPTGNLDTRTSVEVLALLQTLNRQGLTIVLVTHELDIAAYASRHLVFRDGRLRSDEAVASPRDAAAALDALPADEEDAA